MVDRTTTKSAQTHRHAWLILECTHSMFEARDETRYSRHGSIGTHIPNRSGNECQQLVPCLLYIEVPTEI